MKVRELMNKPFTDLTEEEMTLLDNIGVSAWDLIQANSGGHKCITNISGLNYNVTIPAITWTIIFDARRTIVVNVDNNIIFYYYNI
jgi:hypothetical protein